MRITHCLNGKFCVSFHGKIPFLLKGTSPETQNVTKQQVSAAFAGRAWWTSSSFPKCDYIILPDYVEWLLITFKANLWTWLRSLFLHLCCSLWFLFKLIKKYHKDHDQNRCCILFQTSMKTQLPCFIEETLHATFFQPFNHMAKFLPLKLLFPQLNKTRHQKKQLLILKIPILLPNIWFSSITQSSCRGFTA